MAWEEEKVATIQGVERDEHLSIGDLLARIKVEEKDLDLPELGAGAKVRIKPITLDEREGLISGSNNGKDSAAFTVLTIIKGLVRPALPLTAVVELKTGNPVVMDKIAKAIWSISGMATQDQTKNDLGATSGAATS